MKRVLVLGEILVEIMAEKVDQSFCETGTLQGPFASGAPAIFIDQVAKMGVPATIVAAVGEDDFGRLCIERLKKDGVDTSCIKSLQERATGVAFVRYASSGARDFIYHIAHAACGCLSLDDLQSIDWENVGLLHVMGSSLFNTTMFELYKRALEKIPTDCIVSFDPNIRVEILRTDENLYSYIKYLFSQAGLLFSTEEELKFLTATEDLEQSINLCYETGIQVVVVKKGSEGASLHTPTQQLSVAALDVVERDPTGAGDTFAGAFVAAYLRGLDLEKCLHLANEAGAAAVQKQGPMEGTVALLDECPRSP